MVGLHLDVVVEHVVGAGLRGPVSRAHRRVQLRVVVPDPLQCARAESEQGYYQDVNGVN